MDGIYNKIFIMKIKMTEEEKLNILGLHNENHTINKKVLFEQFNPENGTYVVQHDQQLKASIDFNTVFPKVIKAGTVVYHNYKGNDKKIVLGNTGVVTYCDGDTVFPNSFIYNDTITDLKNDKFMSVLKSVFCNGKRLKTWDELTKGNNPDKKDSNPDKKDSNCKSKNPYNAFTDAGLNWSEERKKWIEAKCNGTTPCILGNAQTNINLRNALCDGTWPIKTPEQIQACKTKCAAIPCQPGQICPQVQGWFFSKDRGCYEATGTGGFASKAECEACKCGSQNNPNQGGTLPGEGGQKPGDGGTLPGEGGQKLPDFIPPTIDKPSKPLD